MRRRYNNTIGTLENERSDHGLSALPQQMRQPLARVEHPGLTVLSGRLRIRATSSIDFS